MHKEVRGVIGEEAGEGGVETEETLLEKKNVREGFITADTLLSYLFWLIRILRH